MRRSLWKALVAMVAAATVATTMAAPSVARPMPGTAATAQRSGRIIGSGDIGWNLPCGLAPDCAAWLQSGCHPALAGRDPAWMTSIVNVSALADGKTGRFLTHRNTVLWSGVRFQFWRGNCGELGECVSTNLGERTPGSGYGLDGPLGCHWAEVGSGSSGSSAAVHFVIPRRAKWMTISASSAVNTEWTLR